MMKYRYSICLFLTFVTVLCATTDSGSVLAGNTLSHPRSRSQIEHRDKPLELIAIPEEEEWLALVAAPIAARIKSQRKMPIVIVVPSDPSDKQRQLIEQLEFRSNSFSVISQDPDRNLFEAPDDLPVRLQAVRPNLTKTGILFAKKYWKRINTVVVAYTQDPETAILASTLASNLCVPFIPYESKKNSDDLSKALNVLGVTKVFFCANKQDKNQILASSGLDNKTGFRQKIEVLNSASINKHIVCLLGTNNIRNIILARLPDKEQEVGAQSWIAPYMSIMRGAPVVLCSSSDGTTAEEQVNNFIEEHSLRPRTLTVLGDYDSIGSVTIRDEENLADYEVNVEPCSRPLKGVASMGVGRIPFAEPWACSVMFARGLARVSILYKSEPHVLMIANPNSEYGSLPLAETVSRVTAEEFKNFNISINEFYGISSNRPDIRDAAKKAHLIIYEGHITDQRLFEEPSSIFEYEEESQEDLQYMQPDDLDTNDTTNYQATLYVSENESSDLPTEVNNFYTDFPVSLTTQFGKSVFESDVKIDQLEGLPLIILQSCHSLEEDIANQVFNLGGIGIIGSVTNMHSASGSAFIKTFCDGLLYRGDTVGEALRDARNYFFCLTELKRKRNHTQTAKVYRAALSFCLWGDPELKFAPDLLKRSKRRPVSATFIGRDIISISTPRLRLPRSQTEKYFVRIFPGSEVAGIVKRLKNEEARRILPIYFFRLPLPNRFEAEKFINLQKEGEANDRTAFLVDQSRRYIYILYLPEKETKGEKFNLLFTSVN